MELMPQQIDPLAGHSARVPERSESLSHHVAQEEARAAADPVRLQQSGVHIRALEEYHAFFERHAAQPALDPTTHNTP